MNKPLHYPSFANYTKALARFEKNIRSGQFARYTQQKKWQVWNRLCRYARQLGIRIKAPAAAACLAASFSFTTATAQTYVLQSGTANFFNGLYFGDLASPAFVDLDNDGDKDVYIGSDDGTIKYYKNTGTALAPVFTVQTGALNPFDGVDAGSYSFPSFTDIDNDGDKDAFIGTIDGTIKYYKNTGTNVAPVFTVQAGTANPLNAVNTKWVTRPSFADVDGDGDTDVFVGKYNNFNSYDYTSRIQYYKNTGTVSAPVFTEQTGSANPLNDTYNNIIPLPYLADADRDGDNDAFVCSNSGSIVYYKNTGTKFSPVFMLQTAANNPLSALNGQSWPSLGFVDIDGDTDLDVFVGLDGGAIQYYKNTAAILPLQLLAFNASSQAGYNQLTWKTAGEVNTRSYELEMSSDGRNFTPVATVRASGRDNDTYSTTDHAVYSGKVFYRLKMTDVDGKFTYSQVIWLNNRQVGGASIYPNPVADVLNLNIGNARILNTHAGIYDAGGRLLQNVLISAGQVQINVQLLAKGLYTLKLADGTVQSFIKQ